MAYYYYLVKNNRINSYQGEISNILEGYIRYDDKSFGESEIHYNVKDSKVVALILDSELGESYARVEAEEFLDNL